VEEWAAVCRHAKVLEEEYMSRKHEMDSVMERIIINADNDNKSESSVSCVDDDDDHDDDIQGVGPVLSDSE
jgi:hypothetical protein